jgi:Dolichyl-phosphate-mannose-protein mannosyltransferase
MGSQEAPQQGVTGGKPIGTASTKMLINMVLAALAGFVLRAFFIMKFPVTDSGDAPFYIELSWNWLRNRVYGFPVHGVLTPVDMRTPGYPAFVAAIFAFAGNSPRAVMFAQAVVDVATCFLIALIAARLAPARFRRRVFIAALWLAALCPFTANYTAVVITETVVTFLTALAILILIETDVGVGQSSGNGGFLSNRWFLAGIIVGFGTLVRPETPLILFAAGLVLLAKWRRPRDWTKLVRAGALMGLGLLLPLLPWAARNWRTLHEVQFLAPRHSELPGEYTPFGFIDWTNTWLWRMRDVFYTHWRLNDQAISVDDLPSSAFDSPQERARVAQLLAEYNKSVTLGPELDAQFEEIAHERTARDPLRTYAKIPFLRGVTLWFSPRIDLLPISGDLWPVKEAWQDDRRDFLGTLSLVVASTIYTALALAGLWVVRRRPWCFFLAVFILVRTLFFAYAVETPEPRYVLECFPAVIALEAQFFSSPISFLRRAQDGSSHERFAETAP